MHIGENQSVFFLKQTKRSCVQVVTDVKLVAQVVKADKEMWEQNTEDKDPECIFNSRKNVLRFISILKQVTASWRIYPDKLSGLPTIQLQICFEMN